MPHITSTKWDRTLVLQVPIFIAIWFSLCAALELHFHLIIRHHVLAYQFNTYHLEITGYSDDPWWREFYTDIEFSRLHFGSRPIGPRAEDKPLPHADRGDHASNSETDNIRVVVNENRALACSTSEILCLAIPQLDGRKPCWISKWDLLIILECNW